MGYYPDATHNNNSGWITRGDLIDVIRFSGGSLPRMKFLFNLVKFVNPRRERFTINVHSKVLSEWSDRRTYTRHLDYFQNLGIVERGSGYLSGLVSKNIKLNWNFRSAEDAILNDDRSVDTFHETIPLVFEREEFRQLLKRSTITRRQRYDIIKSIY